MGARLSARLGRPEAEIIAAGQLCVSDFPIARVEILYADGSRMTFKYAFALADQERQRVAVFTEHCGYAEFAFGPEMVVSEDVIYDGEVNY